MVCPDLGTVKSVWDYLKRQRRPRWTKSKEEIEQVLQCWFVASSDLAPFQNQNGFQAVEMKNTENGQCDASVNHL